MKITRRGFLIFVLIGCIAAWFALLEVERWYKDDDPYSLIEGGLYMGGFIDEPPPGTQAVLNLCDAKDQYECEVHSWQPIPDAPPAPSVDWLREQVEFVETQRNAGRTVYVHCAAGVSRSGMVVTAYMMRKHGWTRDEAIANIRVKRPQIRPNPAFMELLSEWEKRLKS